MRVQSNVPDATVWIDDVLVGTAKDWNKDGRQIRAGFHRIEVRHPGYYSFFQEVEVAGGSKVVVNAKLTRADRIVRDPRPRPASSSLAPSQRGRGEARGRGGTRRTPLSCLAELDLARDLVGREVAGAVVDDVLGAAHAGAHHARDDHRTAEVVGDDPRLRRLDLGERLQAALDLAQRDALAVDLDQVVLAAGDGDAAVLVLRPEVAGAEPAVGGEPADRHAVVAFWQVDLRDRQTVESVRDRTQIGPLRPAASLSPLGPATRSSTPSNGRPTVSGSLPARSIASGPACVLW